MKVKAVFFVMLSVLFFAGILSAGDIAKKNGEKQVVKLSANLYRITFDYGLRTNLIACTGKDGVLLIDTGHKQTGEELLETVKDFKSGDVKYIINTHPHGDHRGGNDAFKEKVEIIGLGNIELYVSKGILKKNSVPFKGKTGKSYDLYYIMNFNGQEIWLIPSAGVHSSEDMIIYFKNAGIVRMGDLLLSQSFPATSRNVFGYMDILRKVLEVFPESCKFISGHGKDSDYKDVHNYEKMLLTTIDIVKKGMETGKSIEDLQGEKVLGEYESYNHFLDWLHTDYWIEAVYKNIKAR